MNFWDPTSKYSFHRAVTELRTVTEQPSRAVNYRDCGPEGLVSRLSATEKGGDDIYTLALCDELQIADHVAFLAHMDEGAERVSAAAVLEGERRLDIVLTSNKAPSPRIMTGLQGILDVVSEYSRTARNREVYRRRLFDAVVTFSRTRILYRVRPPWCPPNTNSSFAEPLLDKIKTLSQTLSTVRGQAGRELNAIVQGLQQLVQLVTRFNGTIMAASVVEEQDRFLREIIIKCADISKIEAGGSLERFLAARKIPMLPGSNTPTSASRVVLQIDKLARYALLCDDLLRFARRSTYRPLFGRITILRPEKSYQQRIPLGAGHSCWVHAEVQLALYLEQNTAQDVDQPPPPRAIGCSKAACFLCDLFFQEWPRPSRSQEGGSSHGRNGSRYLLSESHRRLWNKWTIPDVNWMTASQVRSSRKAVNAMTAELMRLTHHFQKERTKAKNQRKAGGVVTWQAIPFGIESRAVLPLSGEETPSILSVESASETKGSEINVEQVEVAAGSDAEVELAAELGPDSDSDSDSESESGSDSDSDSDSDITIKQPADAIHEESTPKAETREGHVHLVKSPRPQSISSLSSGSDSDSNMTVRPGGDATGQQSPRGEDANRSSAASVILTSADLPFARPVNLDSRELYITIDHLTLFVEFLGVSTGVLSISRGEDGDRGSLGRMLKVGDISTEKEITLQGSGSGADDPTGKQMGELGFQVECCPDVKLTVRMFWGKGDLYKGIY